MKIESEDARLLLARKLFDLFKKAKGHDATTFTELIEWLNSPRGRAAKPWHARGRKIVLH